MGNEFGFDDPKKIMAAQVASNKPAGFPRPVLACLGCLAAPFIVGALVMIVGLLLSLFSPASSVTITRAEYGEKWPFTVESGTLWRDGAAIVFQADKNYAVNGPASQQGYQDIDPIWAPAPGGRKDIGPIIDRGNTLAP